MNPILFSIFLFSITITDAQNNTVPITKRTDTLHSTILNEDRYLWVHIPDKAVSAGKRYPVIYVLDGEVHFDEVNNILRSLSKEAGKNIADEMIVVSIGNLW